MISSVLFASLFRYFLCVFASHPLHVSVTEIQFDEKDKALEIMMRVFVDDLEQVMKNRYHKSEMDILNPKDLTLDQMMSDYLKDHFKISLDRKPQKVNYLGHERDGDAFIFYIEVAGVKKWKEIEIFNTMVTETFEDQNNLVHVTVRGQVRSLRLTKDTSVDKLTFDLK
jgi:hypothetical protein